MAPFSANIGFLMMECDEAPMNRVMTLLQEKPLKLPKCDNLACDWQTFKEIYKVIKGQNLHLHNENFFKDVSEFD